MKTRGVPIACNKGLTIDGHVQHGRVCVGETLVIGWSKAGKSTGVVLVIKVQLPVESAWVDATEAVAGSEVKVTVATTKEQGKTLPARFVYKAGAEGKAITEGQTFVAKMYIYSGEELKTGINATCTFSSSSTIDVKLKDIVWTERDEVRRDGARAGREEGDVDMGVKKTTKREAKKQAKKQAKEAKQEAEKQEAAKQEAAKQEAAKQVQAKTNSFSVTLKVLRSKVSAQKFKQVRIARLDSFGLVWARLVV
jgi:hypothetical protein